MEIPIIFEDKDYLIINKPAGLVVHADGKTQESSVSDWILERHPDIKDVGEPWTDPKGVVIHRPGIVHRIDRETSGILLIAKNQDAFIDLKRQFQNREVKKIYSAFVYGEMKEKKGIINREITRSRKDFRRWSAQRGGRGEAREAITLYRVLNETHAASQNLGFSYIELEPKTGRTHQIRVHLKAINHPVVCDSLYAPKRPPALGFERLALHAQSIEFMNRAGKKIAVEAPYPADFIKAIADIESL